MMSEDWRGGGGSVGGIVKLIMASQNERVFEGGFGIGMGRWDGSLLFFN